MSNYPRPSESALPRLAALAPSLRTCERAGTVSDVVGLTVEVQGLTASIGEQAIIEGGGARPPMLCQVVGFRRDRAITMLFGDATGITPSARVVATGAPARVTVGDSLLGRVVDGLGHPLDGGPLLRGAMVPVTGAGLAAHPLRRLPITTPFMTWVRVLDGMLTCGRGQRLGVFAGSGVGKSTFLGMIARNGESDVNVIALIGERGREVREFIDHNLGPEGLRRSVVVVATGDQPALQRLNAAWVAATIAEYFCDRGRNVLLMMDSVTRFAMAQREIGLAAGEPPATRGYTPSVFALLPTLLERSGTGERGSITGFYTVLVEGDDMNEPIADAVRGVLDGHIVLSRELAAANHYPAVDVLSSISRLMARLATPEQQAHAGRVRGLLAAHRSAKDLLEIGAYVAGSNPDIDTAVARLPQLHGFLRQHTHDVSSWEETTHELQGLAQ